MVRLFPQLTPTEEVIYAWQYGFASSFKTDLMRLLTQADIDNQARLAKAFPLEVFAYQQYTYKEGWWQEVQHKMQESTKKEESKDE